MAWKALAAFSLFVALLQVRAEVDCYYDPKCGLSGALPFTRSSDSDCCLLNLTVPMSYHPTGDSSTCQPCIVIGFRPSKLTIEEGPDAPKRQINVAVLSTIAGHDTPVQNGELTVTVEVNPTTSTATSGLDFKFNDGNGDTTTFKERLRQLDQRAKGITVQALNDDDTGELEHFVVEVKSAELYDDENAKTIGVFVGNSMIVDITDDDIIHVGFEVTEYQLNENQKFLTVNFSITERIPAATHFIARPMTYQAYDDQYLELLKKYPDLKPYTLTDEYDQAELEDFDSMPIHFTIPAGSTETNQSVTVTVVDDDLLEPAEEGFRLLLEVDESRTKLSEVMFGRQTALIRIDNTDRFIFGFENEAETVNETLPASGEDKRPVELPLRIFSGRTELPFQLTFRTGDNTSAQLGVDFDDFGQVGITAPGQFAPDDFLEVTINLDNIFEPQEYIEVILDYELILPDPFKPKNVNQTSPLESEVDQPPTNAIVTDRKRTMIILQEAPLEMDATLSVPKVVQEGDSFAPWITVSHLVNATFFVYIAGGESTARSNDYSFEGQSVAFGPTITMNRTNDSVVIERDNLVEPDETIVIKFYVSSSPSDIHEFVNIHNPNETITIKDQNAATIGFTQESVTVSESAGVAVLTVAVMGDQVLATNAEVRVHLSTSTGTAGASDFTPITDMELVFSGAQQQATVSIAITNDDVYEDLETFTANLVLVDKNVQAALSTLQATVFIENDDAVEIGFKDASYFVNEDEGSVSFEVEVKNNRQFDVPIVFTVTDMEGDAVGIMDYDVGTLPQQLLPGHSSVQHSITIVNDDVLEMTRETFTLNLQTTQLLVSVPAGLSEAVVTITDNDNITIGLRYDMYTAAENTSALVCVDIIEGSLANNRDVSAMLETMDMTAIAPNDYEPVSKTLLFTHQTTESCVNISIKGDATLEDNQIFIITLTSSDPAAILATEEADVTIVSAGQVDVMVSFERGYYIYNEADGMAVVDVVLEGKTEVDVVVSVSGGPSTQTTIGADKVVFNDIPVIFTPGGLKKQSVSAPIIDDNVALEDNETVTVNLTIVSPTAGVKLGLHKSTKVIIVDDVGVVTVSFKQGRYFYDEGDGMAVVDVMLVGQIATNVTVAVRGGPSTQTTIGTDRVVFDETVTFTPNGATEKSVSTRIIDDKVALEDNETVTVRLTILSPPSGVELGIPESTEVTIVDNDHVTVNFAESRVEVVEGAGMAEICVEKNLQTIPDLVVGYAARDGTAVGHDDTFIIGSAYVGEDYVLLDSSVTIPKNSLEACFDVFIVDDSEHETNENFFLDLVSSEKSSLTTPSTVEVVITDTDPQPEKNCILSSSLVLETFPNENGMGHNLNISEGCERQLVTSCDDALDLEVRVDFYANDFSSTKVAILYNGTTVIINEDLSLYPASSPIDEIHYQKTMDKTSVSIEEIPLIVSRNRTEVTVSTTSDSLLLGGLCGNINGTLYFPKCKRTVSNDESLQVFKEKYRLKPADQLLRAERSECGLTTNDTVVGDPLMTVPIYAPGFPEPNLHLCYEIHGEADEYFNFVSDSCTSVNAHYVQAPEATKLNIIDSMSVVAIDSQRHCQRISVDVVNCTATVNGDTLRPMSETYSPYEKNGISVRSYKSRVRISVPNCADNSLVMWVICQRQPLQIPFTNTITSPVDMIKFEITRGLNLKETSHGLLGQFWNIPVDVVEYTGAFNNKLPGVDPTLPFYTINVNHPQSEPRSFTGFSYELSWEFESKQCLYVGNNQGGPIGEVVDPNDSVIEGTYEDYITTDAFATNFTYAVFDDLVC